MTKKEVNDSRMESAPQGQGWSCSPKVSLESMLMFNDNEYTSVILYSNHLSAWDYTKLVKLELIEDVVEAIKLSKCVQKIDMNILQIILEICFVSYLYCGLNNLGVHS